MVRKCKHAWLFATFFPGSVGKHKCAEINLCLLFYLWDVYLDVALEFLNGLTYAVETFDLADVIEGVDLANVVEGVQLHQLSQHL